MEIRHINTQNNTELKGFRVEWDTPVKQALRLSSAWQIDEHFTGQADSTDWKDGVIGGLFVGKRKGEERWKREDGRGMMYEGERRKVKGERIKVKGKRIEVEMLGSSEGESSQARNVAIFNF